MYAVYSCNLKLLKIVNFSNSFVWCNALSILYIESLLELAWHSSNVMDCHATDLGSIPGGNVIFTKLHVLRKGQYMGVPSLNDLAVDET